ncbi:MAG TPA: hypothetical protein VMG10_09200, partial [Gemmataceae bacterium]|nr:hypothetical protein [Gemmataceae bacterium]
MNNAHGSPPTTGYQEHSVCQKPVAEALSYFLRSFSMILKTGAADRPWASYSEKHEGGASHHPARRADASGGGVGCDHP